MSKEQLPEEQKDIAQEFGNENYDADIDNSTSDVAAGKTSKIVGIMVLSVLIIGVLIFVFSGEDAEQVAEEEKDIAVYDPKSNIDGEAFNVAPPPIDELDPVIDTVSPEEEVISDVVTLEVPSLPDLQVAELPSTDDFNVEPEFDEEDLFFKVGEQVDAERNALEEQEKEAEKGLVSKYLPGALDNKDNNASPVAELTSNRRESGSMMLMNGGDISLSDETAMVAVTSAETITATKIAFPNRTIAQGKLVDSVLETAINTDLEGKVRAIVSRDVYADFGKAILIPKGSRLIGSYSGSTTRGQTRVLITWDRLIRPDAIDIMINSPASDQFGRSGVPGSVDNKYLELFNNSILLSLITIGTAMAIESSTNTSGITEETQADGDTQTIAKPSDIAAQEIINSISDTAKTVLDGILNVNPTITVPHGTRIKVFVNQDLVFPEITASSNQDGVVFIR